MKRFEFRINLSKNGKRYHQYIWSTSQDNALNSMQDYYDECGYKVLNIEKTGKFYDIKV